MSLEKVVIASQADVNAARFVGRDNRNASASESPRDMETTAMLLKRLDDYLQESLALENREAALVGDVNSALLRLAFQLQLQIQTVLESPSDPAAHFDVLARAIDVMLRVCRQVDRFGHLRMLLTDARRALPQ